MAKGAHALGRTTPSRLLVLPDGSPLDRRALQKARSGERGHADVERRLAAFGVPARRPGESGPAYLARALPQAGVVALRHGGNYRFAFRLGRTRAERAAVRIALPAGPYRTEVDEASWQHATPLRPPTGDDRLGPAAPPTLL